MPIAQCSCSNEYQDRKYGRGLRVFNVCKKGAARRCTVCLSEQIDPNAKVVAGKKPKPE